MAEAELFNRLGAPPPHAQDVAGAFVRPGDAAPRRFADTEGLLRPPAQGARPSALSASDAYCRAGAG
jgi:hypothetical protein